MSKAPNYYIVDAEALPEIFHKVVQARRMLDTGEAETVNQAVQLVGISRSAFYKYKDAVRPFQDMLHGRIVTFQMMLKDEPGILSHMLNFFASSGANILTINQNLPADGVAPVTIALKLGEQTTAAQLQISLLGIPGVVRVREI